MKKQILLLVLAITGSLFVTKAHAQLKLGSNPTTINAGSILEMEATTKGMLMPRVALTTTTTWGLDGVATAGMTIYNTTAGITSSNSAYPANGIGEYFWDGTGWVSKKAGSLIGLQSSISLSATNGNPVFMVPLYLLTPSANLKITYTFLTDNGGGNSLLVGEIPGVSFSTLDHTGPCGGGGTFGNMMSKSVIIPRPVTPTGLYNVSFAPNTNPGCQGQGLSHVNIVVQAVN